MLPVEVQRERQERLQRQVEEQQPAEAEQPELAAVAAAE